jgi:hypothetical protein
LFYFTHASSSRKRTDAAGSTVRTSKVSCVSRALVRVAHAFLLALLLCSSFVAPARAQENLRLAEYAIKVGLIYTFLHYTEWPAETQNTERFTVCIYGADPFGGRLSMMAERTIDQRAIAVERVGEDAAARGCSLVFVNAVERSRWPRLREALAQSGVLTVSDFEGFAAAGGMIELTEVGNHIGVAINSEAVSAAGLSIQERLRRLADGSTARR